jgi:hypothetical protein
LPLFGNKGSVRSARSRYSNQDAVGDDAIVCALAGIFLGKITKWDDPRLTKTNLEAKLPNHDIVVAFRSDGSGTTYIWTDYLAKVSEEWNSDIVFGTPVRSGHRSKHLEEFLDSKVHTVITVCGNADQACPIFPGMVKRYHWGFGEINLLDGGFDNGIHFTREWTLARSQRSFRRKTERRSARS